MLYPIRIKIVIIYKKFFCNHDFFEVSRKEPEPEAEPQYVISAPAPGCNLISAPRLRFRNTAFLKVADATLFHFIRFNTMMDHGGTSTHDIHYFVEICVVDVSWKPLFYKHFSEYFLDILCQVIPTKLLKPSLRILIRDPVPF